MTAGARPGNWNTGMKNWKVALGLGAACAACCAIPLSAAVAGLAALSSGLVAFADELVPAAWAAAGVALVAGGVWLWRRRVAAVCKGDFACSSGEAASGQGGCNKGASNAC